MKTPALLFVVLLGGYLAGNAQTLTPSTIGQVYNYAIGDTFETISLSHPSIGPNACVVTDTANTINIITGKTQNGDVLTYTVKQYVHSQSSCIPGYTGPFVTDSATQTLTYTKLDSSVFASFSSHHLGCDTFHNCFTDTVYLNAGINNLKFNDYRQVLASTNVQYDSIFANGLGLFSGDYYYIITLPDNDYAEHDYCHLVYYHKADGTSWGIPLSTNTISAINNIEEMAIAAKLFPNPADGDVVLQLQAPVTQALQLKIFDALGRLVKALPITSSTTTIQRENLAGGIYLWQLGDEKEVVGWGKVVWR